MKKEPCREHASSHSLLALFKRTWLEYLAKNYKIGGVWNLESRRLNRLKAEARAEKRDR